ncbi:hypothetical protein HanIR_Chr14g0690531 [Helianthus annuus]|nr:hypothetical protein HanIR_Chr14g0690531 [Helianthus annuus]
MIIYNILKEKKIIRIKNKTINYCHNTSEISLNAPIVLKETLDRYSSVVDLIAEELNPE